MQTGLRGWAEGMAVMIVILGVWACMRRAHVHTGLPGWLQVLVELLAAVVVGSGWGAWKWRRRRRAA
jgi:hypothetical protein